MLGVVQLREPLDHAGQQQHRERRGGDHGSSDLLAPRDQPTLHTEAGLELFHSSAHHLLVLEFLTGEAQQ